MDKRETHKCVDKDELLIQTAANIEKFGLQVIMVGGTDYSPSFAYSIGLYKTYRHPEIICFGLSDNLGHVIINDVAELIKSGEWIESLKDYDNIFRDSRAAFLRVDERNVDHYFRTAINFYGGAEFPALQLVWTDRNDRFPWEENFEETFLYDQPLLDRNADFKFREEKNLAVFTTRQWLELKEAVLRVVHDTDGDWQFLTGDQTPEDIRLVALEEIVTSDKTLNEIFDLDYGHSAERAFPGDEWVWSKMDDAEQG
ncbi:DUF4262 domain-containing protein [Niabella pedocola]|uniref:DUF4262 domain-containing protein n=1 Tax=Niabella pedocola TaxID=1752077 RepID=A0ABS8PWQ4_9BACT|nr:DUF4262 domain-containing protein [Niabella pedocola]MCD2425514.1 DUF4262 domain-containing protein [Niabella pedocola]